MGQLIVSKKGAVGTIVFSNPTKMNAMTFDMWMGVPKALKEFEADPDIRVIVLKGDGEKAFISGADISQFEDLRSTPEGHQAYEDHLAVAMKYPTVCSKPVIAQIKGYCFGGGLGLAAACDIRICSEDATFRMPAARLPTWRINAIGLPFDNSQIAKARGYRWHPGDTSLGKCWWIETQHEQDEIQFLAQIGCHHPEVIKQTARERYRQRR